jgi:hypothetical protein
LVIYWNLLAGMPATATGNILGTGAILFFWVSGAVITGLLVLLTRGLPSPLLDRRKQPGLRHVCAARRSVGAREGRTTPCSAPRAA